MDPTEAFLATVRQAVKNGSANSLPHERMIVLLDSVVADLSTELHFGEAKGTEAVVIEAAVERQADDPAAQA
jgi:hypothetical protein